MQQPGGTSPIPLTQHLAGQAWIRIGLLAPPTQQTQLGQRIEPLRQHGKQVWGNAEAAVFQRQQPGLRIQLGLVAQLLQPAPTRRGTAGRQLGRLALGQGRSQGRPPRSGARRLPAPGSKLLQQQLLQHIDKITEGYAFFMQLGQLGLSAHGAAKKDLGRLHHLTILTGLGPH